MTSSMTSHHDRRQDTLSTSRDYEQEAEHTRRRLAENLDELSDRLTPGQMLDEMMTYSRAGGGTFFRAFTNAMRQSPLPSLLIGTGCMMFLSEKMGMRAGALGNGGTRKMASADDRYGAYRGTSRVSDTPGRMSDMAGRMTGSASSAMRSATGSVRSGLSSAAEAASRQTSNVTGAVADTMRQTAATVSDTVAGAADTVRGTTQDIASTAATAASTAAEQARRSAQNVAGAVRDTASSMGGAIAGTASSMGGALADTATRTSRQAADAVRQSRDSVASFITEQPLLCAAIGVAVGAALASLLPSTETEDQLMGEASDAVKGAAGQVGSDALESAKNVASKVADRAQSAVKEEGLSPSAVADAARSLGEGMQEGARRSASPSGVGAHPTGMGSQRGGPNEPITGTGPQEGFSGQRRG